jgi:hypothetical protein
MPKFTCAPNPCATCPYRKDVPSGVWAKEEYDKLPNWDNIMGRGVFLCHNGSADTKGKVLCRGWMEVHEQNIFVRLAMAQTKFNDANIKPTKVPLYKSGAAARKAGLRDLNRPNLKAMAAVAKIEQRRAKLKAKKCQN